MAIVTVALLKKFIIEIEKNEYFFDNSRNISTAVQVTNETRRTVPVRTDTATNKTLEQHATRKN